MGYSVQLCDEWYEKRPFKLKPSVTIRDTWKENLHNRTSRFGLDYEAAKIRFIEKSLEISFFFYYFVSKIIYY